MTATRRAVFLDRDGVLNANVVRKGKPYPPRSVAEVVIPDGTAEALEQLREVGFLLIGATNQPDVGRGTLTQAAVEEIHRHLLDRLPLDEIRVCYEADDACPRRKPNPGMLLEAAAEHGIDLGHSFLIGDRWKDVESGRRAGVQTVFLNLDLDEPPPRPAADFTAHSLAEAVDWILFEALTQLGSL